MLGCNGILLDQHVIRHRADLEAIHIFQVTMQTLIVGRHTGIDAFTRENGSGNAAAEHPTACPARQYLSRISASRDPDRN